MGKYQLYKRIFLSKFNLNIGVFILFSSIVITFFSIGLILNNITGDEKLQKDNYIEILDIAVEASRYIEATKGYEIFQNQYLNRIDYFDYEEIIELSKEEYVNNIYVIDDIYINDISDKYINDEIEDELYILSYPDIVMKSPNYQQSFPGMSGFLISGRSPEENKYEAMVSYETMQKHWNYKGDINDLIGMKLDIENKEYTIVGITNLPMVTISYSDNLPQNIHSTIKVSEESSKELKNILKYKEENDYNAITFSSIFIDYDNNYVDELMKYLIDNAQSYQYVSNHVNDVLKIYQFKGILPIMLAVVTLICIIFSIIFIYVAKKSFSMIYNYIMDIDNLNFDINKNKRALNKVIVTDYIIVLPILYIMSYTMLRENIIFITPFYIINFLSFMISVYILKNIGKKND